MTGIMQELDWLEEKARPYARSLEMRGRRFFAAFLPAFFTALLTASSLTWGTVWSIAFAVTITTLGEIDPSIPWSTFTELLDRARYRSAEPLNVTKPPPTSPPRTRT